MPWHSKIWRLPRRNIRILAREERGRTNGSGERRGSNDFEMQASRPYANPPISCTRSCSACLVICISRHVNTYVTQKLCTSAHLCWSSTYPNTLINGPDKIHHSSMVYIILFPSSGPSRLPVAWVPKLVGRLTPPSCWAARSDLPSPTCPRWTARLAGIPPLCLPRPHASVGP